MGNSQALQTRAQVTPHFLNSDSLFQKPINDLSTISVNYVIEAAVFFIGEKDSVPGSLCCGKCK